MTTGINYLDETWNPVTGCSGKGCKAHCWAREMAKRFPAIHGTKPNWLMKRESCFSDQVYAVRDGDKPIPFSAVQFHPDRLGKPLHWRKPRRIGVCFMGDWMDDQVKCAWIDQILEVIAACPQHQFFSLTKQPQNLEKKIYGHCPESPARELGGGDYLPNLYNGVSITDQEDAYMKESDLISIPGKHWLSIEPMIGVIPFLLLKSIHWVVVGCESGPKRRPMPLEWAYSVVEQCQAAGVPVWVKQIDLNGKVCHDITKFPPELQVREFPA